MIEYKCNMGNISMKAQGNILEIGADAACLIYKIMHDVDDSELKQVFADIVMEAILDGLGVTDGKELLREIFNTDPEVLNGLVNDIKEVVGNET